MFVTIDQKQILMQISGLSEEAYDRWMTDSLDDWDDPEWIEMAQHEVGWPEDSMSPREHRRELRFLEEYESTWMQEKVDRLLKANGYSNPLPCGWQKMLPPS